MSTFDAIRNNKRLVQFFLLIIIVSFAVWGLDAYFQGGGDTTLATVGKTRITVAEFQDALREQQAAWRRQAPNADISALDTPELRLALLEDMAIRRAVLLEANRLRLNVQGVLRDTILNAPEFQENGAFSQERYQSLLAANNMSAPEFESSLQENLLQQTLLGAVQEGTLVPLTVARQIAALQSETRQVEESLIAWQGLAKQADVTEAEAQGFYDANTPRFTLPEQVRVEYLTFGQKDLEAQEKPDEQTARAWYDTHREQFAIRPERRRASHILTSSKNVAEVLLAEARQNPERFAELAKTRSEDGGSAQQGGDLGFFDRASMVAPFASAAFALRKGEISGVVESEFGFHIIYLTDIQPGQYSTFAEARVAVEAELKREGAARRYAENAEKFANLVYEQFSSLEPVAEAFGLATRQSGWLTREIDPREKEDALRSKPLREAMFSDEAIKSGHNTKAVEVAPGLMASARLLEHRPATPMPFADVKQDILKFLRQEKAQALAVTQGKESLAALEGAEAANSASIKRLKWSKPQSISRENPGKLHPLAVNAVFRVFGGAKPPLYTGVEVPGVGYAIYRISRVTAGEVGEEALTMTRQQLVRINAQTQLSAYLASLRQRYAVEINRGKLLEENSKD
ncbi:MAG: SurA N-terminal domain-containing protein [Zoogloeaceae bacterium]|nr:SurA N-terminal domain-containing protein [Zoogloeaceae bacterium]